MTDPVRKAALIRIARKVLNGRATAEEKQFLKKYYDYFDKDSLEPMISAEERQALEHTIWHRINTNIDKPYKNRTLQRAKFIRIAAAILLLISAAGIYYWYHPVQKEQTIANPSKKYAGEDIKPGSNKAILTLANGSSVMLNSIHTGTVAVQGNSKVLKVSNGQLVYNTGNNNTGSKPTYTPADVKYNTLVTPRGGQYQLILPDGTKVWLNSASSLTFPTAFTGRERDVSLKGEAYFEVAEDKRHPFKVQVGNMEVKDLGTRFDIMAYSDEPVITTTLLEGAVRVTRGDANVLLRPGQQAIADNNIEGKISTSAADTAKAVAWKNGYFTFHRTNIYEIMRQISRWYDVDVSYRDSLNVILNGNISRNVNASEVFKMLELTGELQFIISGKKVIVSERDENINNK